MFAYAIQINLKKLNLQFGNKFIQHKNKIILIFDLYFLILFSEEMTKDQACRSWVRDHVFY